MIEIRLQSCTHAGLFNDDGPSYRASHDGSCVSAHLGKGHEAPGNECDASAHQPENGKLSQRRKHNCMLVVCMAGMLHIVEDKNFIYWTATVAVC